jgi:hypothetical protein
MLERLTISALVYMMVQAVLFGAGLVIILMSPLSSHAAAAIVWMIAITMAISAPLSYVIAPRLTAGYWRGRPSDVVSG